MGGARRPGDDRHSDHQRLQVIGQGSNRVAKIIRPWSMPGPQPDRTPAWTCLVWSAAHRLRTMDPADFRQQDDVIRPNRGLGAGDGQDFVARQALLFHFLWHLTLPRRPLMVLGDAPIPPSP